jgi:hypothetical protein
MKRETGSVWLAVGGSLLAFVIGGALVGGAVLYLDEQVRGQIEKRGRYIATNLAYNSKYSVLTEDHTLAQQLARGSLVDPEIAAVTIRTVDGKPLGVAVRRGGRTPDVEALPQLAGPYDRRTVNDPQLGELTLFRAPVITSGEEPGAAATSVEFRGSVEVALTNLESHTGRWLSLGLLGALFWCLAPGLVLFRLASRMRSPLASVP